MLPVNKEMNREWLFSLKRRTPFSALFIETKAET